MRNLLIAKSDKAWRSLMYCLIGTVLGAAVVVLHLDLGRMSGTAAMVIAALSLTAAWLLAVQFLMIDTWGRYFWWALNLGSGVLLAVGGNVGLGFAIAFSVVFLSVRRYRPWRLVPARRRALGFALGLAAIVILGSAQRLWNIHCASGLGQVARGFAVWSLWSLLVFWCYSLFHLAVRMRLHFLRLRPKLAVSAFLIGVVPLLLMVGLAAVVVYSTLGGARASRLDNTLESWRVLTAGGADLSGALFDTTFVWPDGDEVARPGVTVIPAPDWVSRVAQGMRSLALGAARVHRDGSGAPAAVQSDSTAYFLIDRKIWLMRWQDLAGDQPRVRAWQLGERPLRQLSGILQAGLDFKPMGDTSVSVGSGNTDTEGKAGPGGVGDFHVSYRDSMSAGGSVPAFWNKYLYFGGSLQEMLTLRKNRVETATLFIQLRVGWPDLTGEFVTGDSNLNVLVVVGLGLAVLLFLVTEIFAFFFGVRISEGIVAGVHALHRGTRAVAAGELDTVIEIPNEDEFGDLAASFNEMTLAVSHGRQIALANERLTQELATAGAIQTRLLPSDEPRVLDFEVTGASIPSREVGGDYYDFLAQGEDRIGIAIGDVSGKGMPAALLMSNLQASLHGQVLHPGTVAGVVARVNDLLVRSTDTHMFATFFYGLLDAKSGTFTCTNAGHNPPLVMRTDGSMEELTTGGLLLGMLADQPYQQDSVTLASGDVIVMYTDGITEAVGPSAEEDDPKAMFGEEALYDVVRTNRHLPAAAIKSAILAAVTAHTAGVAQSDDITLVVIRRQG